MAQYAFEIEIRRNGEVKVHVQGAKGKACMEYVEFLKELVGPVKQQQLTHEYYEHEQNVHIHQHVQQRIIDLED